MNLPRNEVKGWRQAVGPSANQILAVALLLLCTTVAQTFGQIHGVPPTITSTSVTGIISAPRPSITSPGPFGWQTPPQFFDGQFFPLGGFAAPFIPTPLIPGPFVPGLFSQGRFGPGALIPDRQGFFNGGTQSSIISVVVPYGYSVPYPVGMPGSVLEAARSDDQEDPVATASSESSLASSPSSSLPAASSAPSPVTEQQQTTVLVLHDGKHIEVRNYAIVGDQIVNFGGSPHRIALRDLDLNATSQLNDDRGVNFRLPANRVGKESAAK